MFEGLEALANALSGDDKTFVELFEAKDDDGDLPEFVTNFKKRVKDDRKRRDFNDLMWEDGLEGKYKFVPTLKPSDILVVPGEPRLYFMDWFGIGLSVFSALISLTILVLTIQR